ncbi:hypothetical protein XF35_38960 [Streptomyces platensis subsp. clarensis]|uniref:Uncharacterized protein n=1 Tax=Streptomyces showdoensis TaxID=68268 RepID=A0A2P2GKU6_STREW|nr:hypothetical protein [Streptomyces showdoensis]KKZ72127.1 hypothetical protein VO63_20355 [Streptomyces showdoensis]MCW7991040.1 hypothetical protein [Streptomyces platensis subsp. clarensis]
MTTAVLALAALTVGYVFGRTQPAPRLLSWAEDHAHGGWRNPGNWAAQVIFAIGLAYMWTFRPRRTLANVRSWREAQRLAAIPSPPVRVHRITPTPEEPTP